MPYLSGAVEGVSDEAVLRRVIASLGADVHRVQVQNGKVGLRRALPGYNNAAQGDPWVVLVDLDDDFDCAPSLVVEWLPHPSHFMRFRVVVRQIEAWLMADAVRFATFFGVREAAVSVAPDELPNVRAALLALVATSRRREIRDDMLPRPRSGRRVGRSGASSKRIQTPALPRVGTTISRMDSRSAIIWDSPAESRRGARWTIFDEARHQPQGL